MLRSKSFHKSSPSLNGNMAHCSSSGTARKKASDFAGRDELQEKYLDLRDHHFQLKRDARDAQNQIRFLHSKLSRLIAEKKRYYRNVKSEREIALEEQIFDLEQQLHQQTKQNDRLKERLQLIRVQSPVNSLNRSLGVGLSGTFSQHQRNINQHQYQAMFTTSSTTTASVPLNQRPGRRSQVNRISSAYAHVQSRTDSGLGVYFRPLNVSSRSKSQSDLRQDSGTAHRLSVRFQSDSDNTDEQTNQDYQSTKLPFSATLLMQEAKEEIIRLESIIEQQQTLIKTLNKIPDSENASQMVNFSNGQKESYKANLNLDNHSNSFEPVKERTNSNEISYQITSTTTTTTATNLQTFPRNSLTRSTSLIRADKGESSNHMITANGIHVYSQSPTVNSIDANENSVDLLWSKYQRILLHKESARRISGEVQSLIERLYKALCDEKEQVSRLKAELNSRQEYSVVLTDKEKQIETLLKENMILQESINQCAEQCIGTMNSETNKAGESYQSQVDAMLAKQQSIMQQELNSIKQELSKVEEAFRREVDKNRELQVKYDSLQQLNETDQLHIKHLKAKVTRLSNIVFRGDSESQSKQLSKTSRKNFEPTQSIDVFINQSRLESHSNYDEDFEGEEEENGDSNLENKSSDEIDELDSILNLIPLENMAMKEQNQ